MTSSFTNMVVAGQALSYLDDPDEFEVGWSGCRRQQGARSRGGAFRQIAEVPFERAVFLGDGALHG